MYGYDANSKCFISVTEFSSKNYSPIVFYKMHEHFYLIDDATTIRSIAESNKHEQKKVISSTITEEVKQTDNDLKVTLIDKFDVDNALQMESGIYLLQQSNLNKEIIQFITKYNNVPRNTSRKHSIIQFKFERGLISKKKDKEYVIICVDSTYGERFNYENVKNVADSNDIPYTNEGLGSVILKVIENSKRQKRISIDREKFFDKYGKICNICELESESQNLEIDHILPLSSGGTNEENNLQALCIECHKKKTSEENEMVIYRIKNEMASYFNERVNKNIMKSWELKSWQFVENILFLMFSME